MIILKCNKNRKRVKTKMKKMNSKGFTLIELLAVITIMGILMMVAIPSVSRTIENSRRDTFANIAHEYVNAIRNGVLADNIECVTEYNASKYITASATPDGWYYFHIDTMDQGTQDLMESGGKSPFGNAEMEGYVLWHKATKNKGADNQTTTTTYYARLVDSGKHGFDEWLREEDIKRANISTATDEYYENIAEPDGEQKIGAAKISEIATLTDSAALTDFYECKLS